MLVLAAVMFVEKAVSWGRRVTLSAGLVLAGWGLAPLVGVPGVPRPFWPFPDIWVTIFGDGAGISSYANLSASEGR